MSRLTVLFWGLLFLTAGLLVSLDGWGRNGGSTPPPPPIPGKIQHIVVIFQENRTPDNLFHDSVLISRGADIASSGINSDGQTTPLAPVSLATDYDPNHSHNSFVLMYDKGKMDGADKIPVFCKPGATDCPAPNLQFAYVNPSEVAPYFQMAGTLHVRGSYVPDQPGTEFPGTPVYYFGHIGTHCNQQFVRSGESRRFHCGLHRPAQDHGAPDRSVRQRIDCYLPLL